MATTSARPTSTSTRLVKGKTGDNTVFDEDFDDAPTILVKGPARARTTANVRKLEREMSGTQRMGSDHQRL